MRSGSREIVKSVLLSLLCVLAASCKSEPSTTPHSRNTANAEAGSEPAPAGNEPANAPKTPSAMKSQETPVSTMRFNKKVSWGYGCGGHCAFNFSGESDVTIAFFDNTKVSVTDIGTSERRENYPDNSYTDTRTWKNVYKGTMKEDGGAMILKLESHSVTCGNVRSGGEEGEKKSTCPPAKPHLELRCSKEEVKVYEKMPAYNETGKSTLTLAWVCKAAESKATIAALADYMGTEFPWVFGIDSTINTVESGEPQPETYYIGE